MQVIGVFERFAPCHLLHQKRSRHGGVVFGLYGRATQFAQVGGTLKRVLQALMRLVNAHGPLHGQALRSTAFVSPEGVLYPCHVYDRPLGNLREKPLAEIWRAAGFERVRLLATTVPLQASALLGVCPAERGTRVGPG